jgi:hypothetical protein
MLIPSCNNVDSAKQELVIPKPPACVDAVKAEIKTKSYQVGDVGAIDLFNEFDWASTSNDTTKFYREYINERKNFTLQFLNDTIAKVHDEKKTFEAKYNLEKDTSTAVLLNLQYVDSSFSFNPGEPMMITSAYKIKGVDNNSLLLETPREMNRRKIILLMKTK